MYYWAVFTLLIVVVVKYYTAIEMRKLERRLEAVKEGLQLVKQNLQEAHGERSKAEALEESYAERYRRMKETIEDLQIRLSTPDELEAAVVVSSAKPTPVPF